MPATLDHESFGQPADPKVSLWRYMDLSKFTALLQKRALIFPRADKLGDPFEGSVPEPNARFLDSVRATRGTTADPFSGISDAALEAMADHMSQARRKMTKATYISCWHMNEAESAGMWKLYSKSSDAVCIKTDYGTLASLLPQRCFMGVVSYIDFKTASISPGNLFNPFMIKRRSFAHEREARALIWNGDEMDQEEKLPLLMEVPVPLAKLVKAIYVSPEAPDWFKDVVAGLAKRYRLSVPVEHSEINAVPLY